MGEKQDDGGPAFASSYTEMGHNQEGMSLRDWFAGQALAGMCAHPGGAHIIRDVKMSYDYADAMLAERKRTGG